MIEDSPHMDELAEFNLSRIAGSLYAGGADTVDVGLDGKLVATISHPNRQWPRTTHSSKP